MISCKQATELVSRALDQPLAPGQRLRLRLHLLICRQCRRYRKQLHFLKRATSKLDSHIEEGTPSLAPEAKQRIEKNIAGKEKS